MIDPSWEEKYSFPSPGGSFVLEGLNYGQDYTYDILSLDISFFILGCERKGDSDGKKA